jgi:hypothetical protein
MVKEMSFVRMAGLRRCLIWKNTFSISTILNGGLFFTRWERPARIEEQFQGREEKVGWVRNNLSCVWQLWLMGISRG